MGKFILIALTAFVLCEMGRVLYEAGKEDGELELLRKGFDAGWEARSRACEPLIPNVEPETLEGI